MRGSARAVSGRRHFPRGAEPLVTLCRWSLAWGRRGFVVGVRPPRRTFKYASEQPVPHLKPRLRGAISRAGCWRSCWLKAVTGLKLDSSASPLARRGCTELAQEVVVRGPANTATADFVEVEPGRGTGLCPAHATRQSYSAACPGGRAALLVPPAAPARRAPDPRVSPQNACGRPTPASHQFGRCRAVVESVRHWLEKGHTWADFGQIRRTLPQIRSSPASI